MRILNIIMIFIYVISSHRFEKKKIKKENLENLEYMDLYENDTWSINPSDIILYY